MLAVHQALEQRGVVLRRRHCSPGKIVPRHPSSSWSGVATPVCPLSDHRPQPGPRGGGPWPVARSRDIGTDTPRPTFPTSAARPTRCNEQSLHCKRRSDPAPNGSSTCTCKTRRFAGMQRRVEKDGLASVWAMKLVACSCTRRYSAVCSRRWRSYRSGAPSCAHWGCRPMACKMGSRRGEPARPQAVRRASIALRPSPGWAWTRTVRWTVRAWPTPGPPGPGTRPLPRPCVQAQPSPRRARAFVGGKPRAGGPCRPTQPSRVKSRSGLRLAQGRFRALVSRLSPRCRPPRRWRSACRCRCACASRSTRRGRPGA